MPQSSSRSGSPQVVTESLSNARFKTKELAGPVFERLIVVINDYLSAIIAKGEVTPRYYNPGNLFREVHIVLTNDDRPDLAAVQVMVGSAKLTIHNLPQPSRFFLRSCGWQPWLMKSWLAQAEKLVRAICPQIVRSYGAGVNAVAARHMAGEARVPMLLSLHAWPGLFPEASFKEKVRTYAYALAERRELRAAGRVLPVYRNLEDYLRRIGVSNYTLSYNVLATGVTPKIHYNVGTNPRIISVGRLLPGKNPRNLINAMQQLSSATLTIVGNGPLRIELADFARSIGVGERVTFISAMPNRDLCQTLAEFDIFAVHNDFPGLPKAVMEPMLAGLPVVVNRGIHGVVPELSGDVCMQVEDNAEGYAEALRRLLNDHDARAELGRRGRAYAIANWDPAVAEAHLVSIYRDAVGSENG